MFTSDIDTERRRLLRHCLGDLIAAAFCALFGGIYEAFSFGVFSFYMIYAFAFPLAAGIIMLILFIKNKPAGRLFLDLFQASAAAAAVGSLAKGVVEIYGTENRLLTVYPIAAGLLFAAALAAFITDLFRARSQTAVQKTNE